MDYRIKETLAKVEQDLSVPHDIHTLAASVNLSLSRFRHLFKQETGNSFKKHVNGLRLDEARRLLETTHLRIKEVRQQVGAPSETLFLRDFKERFGETPLNYRRSRQNNSNGNGNENGDDNRNQK